MDQIKQTFIRTILNKVGILNLVAYLITFIPYAIIYKLLNGDSNSYLGSLKSVIIFTLPLYLSLFATTIFIFKLDIGNMFVKKETSYNLSIKAKIKLTLLFTSLYLFSSIISTYIMRFHIGNEVAENPFFIGELKEVTYKLLYIGIIIPIIEEIIFRGAILRELKDCGSLFAIIISSLVFMIPHSSGFLHAFIAGVILGFCYIITGNIRWSIMFHIVCNFGIVVITGWFELFFPFINLNVIRLAVGVILIAIFFMTAKKDEELKAFYNIVNFKTVINQIKNDKEKYKNFITSPSIIALIVFGVFRFIFGLV